MKIYYPEIDDLNITIPKDLSRLIVQYLCSNEYNPESNKKEEQSLLYFINNAKNNKMNFNQFNELMLLLNQDLIGKDFFNFFFEKKIIGLDELKKGVINFRAFAMLCFGNFRFAYKKLSRMNKSELDDKLSPYHRNPTELESELKIRATKLLEIDKIEKDKTWFLGYVSGGKVNKETEVSEKEKKPDKAFLQFRENLTKMSCEIEEAQRKAMQNTDVYLTWDCIDVYFATSMRDKWEFEQTYEFIEEVFKDQKLNEFSLRYFDPTQSICKNSREKGLVEGLMLRRATSTIYLAQESDTMGKDSELAVTLAQSKPVIAYVPKHVPEVYSTVIENYPLNFFKKRLLILDAEDSFGEILRDLEWKTVLLKCEKNFEQYISEFLDELEEYRSKQPYELFSEKEMDFKKTNKNFHKICKILAIVECFRFEKRAKLLNGIHPLSMQVDLQTGVANGVLVVRNAKDCAKLLYEILTNQMTFTIENDPEGFVILKEKITGSSFRVVVDNEKLTNSFWNLFFPLA